IFDLVRLPRVTVVDNVVLKRRGRVLVVAAVVLFVRGALVKATARLAPCIGLGSGSVIELFYSSADLAIDGREQVRVIAADIIRSVGAHCRLGHLESAGVVAAADRPHERPEPVLPLLRRVRVSSAQRVPVLKFSLEFCRTGSRSPRLNLIIISQAPDAPPA